MKPRSLMTRVQMCTACRQEQVLADIAHIRSALTPSTPVVSEPDLTAIPPGFKVRYGVAHYKSTKPRGGATVGGTSPRWAGMARLNTRR